MSESPLLIDSASKLGIELLKKDFESLPYASAILRRALRDPNNVNVEELLTRAHSTTPYDGENVPELESSSVRFDANRTKARRLPRVHG